MCSSCRALGVLCCGAETKWALATMARSLMQCATTLDLLPDVDNSSGVAAHERCGERRCGCAGPLLWCALGGGDVGA